MKPLILFVTGTDTGVGKTVITALLTRQLRATGLRVLALKPICSGGRQDAHLLRQAQDRELSLDTVNPYHFRRGLAPVLAARAEGRALERDEVRDVVVQTAARAAAQLVLVEGAGGLLSPLGEGFDSRDLLTALRATPLVVAPNRLGTVNQVRLVLDALPARTSRRALVVLTQPDKPDRATAGNSMLLGEFIAHDRLVALPRIPSPPTAWPPTTRVIARALTALTDQLRRLL